MTLKPQDLRNMTTEELGLKVESLQQETFRLQHEATSGRIEKPHRLREIRRDIARCKTILHEQQQRQETSSEKR